MASSVEPATADEALGLGSSKEYAIFGLKELVNNPNNISTIPKGYLRLDQEPPATNCTLDQSTSTIPTIDLQKLLNHFAEGSSAPDSFRLELEKLRAACKDWGVFQLVNHGVETSVIEKLKHGMTEFYELPLEEKMKYKIRAGDYEGYGSLIRSVGTLDWGDRIYMTTNPIHRRRPHLFPEFPSFFRTSLESYLQELQKLGMTLIGLMMGKALKIDSKEIEEMFEDGMQSVRMVYYPPCPTPEVVMGIAPHSDVGGVTILNQLNGVDGLEIKKDGRWIAVRILPDALIVNVGDILEIMSNGEYKSVEHRAAVNSEKERISIAFFMNPKYEDEVGPVRSLISNPGNPPLFKRMVLGDFLNGYFSRNRIDGKSYLDSMRVPL